MSAARVPEVGEEAAPTLVRPVSTVGDAERLRTAPDRTRTD
jgi:hypothetical protein